jgi:hypothetical protein
MGHYTELKFKAKLRTDTPGEVINLLKRVLIDGDLGLDDKVLFSHEDVFDPGIEHELFKCKRWEALFLSTNWDDEMQGGKMYFGKYWTIDIHAEFKNYDDEIDKFMDWISPFVVGRKKKQYVGYYQGESLNFQVNLYINR